MMNILHDKLFEVICKESSVSEGMFARQREILRKQADLLTILPTYITCDLTQSVRVHLIFTRLNFSIIICNLIIFGDRKRKRNGKIHA